MCYGGCDCQRCSGEPPVIKKSDRQQCSDDWKEHMSWLKVHERKNNDPMVIFHKEYEGFEALADVERDVGEAFNGDYNPKSSILMGEYQGTVTVTITYTPEKL